MVFGFFHHCYTWFAVKTTTWIFITTVAALTMYPTCIYIVSQFQGRPYSTSADMWSLGCVISYFCNRDHLFTDVASVLNWEGRISQSTLQSDKYSSKLRGLVACLLLPNKRARASARMVLDLDRMLTMIGMSSWSTYTNFFTLIRLSNSQRPWPYYWAYYALNSTTRKLWRGVQIGRWFDWWFYSTGLCSDALRACR